MDEIREQGECSDGGVQKGVRESGGLAKAAGGFMRKCRRFVPSFARLGFFSKIALTITLAGFCADLFYAKINPAFSLIRGALTFSPLPYAQALVEKEQLKTAEEYIDFYGSIPGVELSPEMLKLRKEIHDERSGMVSGALHQAKHAWKGVTGQESDEFIAKAADVAVDFTGAGDVRDLWTEYRNYSEGREVDKLSAGLAGIGLAMTLGEFAGGAGGIVTGGASAAGAVAMFEPIKKAALIAKNALKFMNPKLKKACQKLFEPVFRQVANLNLLKNMPSLTNVGALRDYAAKNMNKIADIAKNARNRMGALDDFTAVFLKNPYAARQIAESAADVNTLSRLSGWALKAGRFRQGDFPVRRQKRS